jgi:hypothetical protein
MINITHFLGLGSAMGMTFDNKADYLTLTYLLFGGVFRPRLSMEFGLMFGGSLLVTIEGEAWTVDSEPLDITGGYWKFPSNFKTWLTFRASDHLTLMMELLFLGSEKELPASTTALSTDFGYNTWSFCFLVLYSFNV